MRCCVNKDAFPIPNFRWTTYLHSKQKNHSPKEDDHLIARWFNLLGHSCSHFILNGQNIKFVNYSLSCFASNTEEWMNITRKFLTIEEASKKKQALAIPIRDIEMELLTADYQQIPNGVGLKEKFILRCCANEDAFPTPRFQWHTLTDLNRSNWTRLSETHDLQLKEKSKRKV